MAETLQKQRPAVVPRIRVWIELDGEVVFGDGRLILLEAIRETGSIKQAAVKLGMSYRAAWGKLKTTEERLGIPLVVKHQGGNGGADLTEAAKALLDQYRKFQRETVRAVDRSFLKNLGGFWE